MSCQSIATFNIPRLGLAAISLALQSFFFYFSSQAEEHEKRGADGSTSYKIFLLKITAATQGFLGATKLLRFLPSVVTNDPTGFAVSKGIPQSAFFLGFLKIATVPSFKRPLFNLSHSFQEIIKCVVSAQDREP